ncbi:MAG: hypothetical protein Q7R41_03860, partial [Phycisphaerales bacterium]|nr:hypothetical protein [Phycisphaerales bacterium]
LCEDPCHESLENGYFVLCWAVPDDLANYHYWIAGPGVRPPPSLWVEWRFRSNHPLPRHSYGCDADFKVQFAYIFDLVNMYGDAVVSWSGAEFVWHLPNNEFRTYRFESPDGVNYWFSVDGLVFRTTRGDHSNGSSFIQMAGLGGCLDDWIPDMENAWDFVRFGTIGYGERLVASDPPDGFVDARQHAPLDHFTISFDSPNYVYLNDITVDVTDGVAPIPIQTRRLDNGPPDVVEIVLDRPIPCNATTRFTFNDGALSQTLEYTFAPGDTNGDGRADLADFAYFQNCFGLGTVLSNPAPCAAVDFTADPDIDLSDFAAFERIFAAP